MGYMRHHAILVTSGPGEKIEAAHNKASEIFSGPGELSPLASPVMNSTRSFAAYPDGSKEGVSESDVGDAKRAAFIGYLNSQAYEDGSTSLDWVEVQYGDEEGDTVITRDSDEQKRAKRPNA